MKFSLPGIIEFEDLNRFFLEKYRQSPDLFYAEAVIDSIYGSVPGLMWNGGRNSPVDKMAITDVAKLMENYAKYDVKLRFTFTNCLLDDSLLCDEYSEELLAMIDNYRYEVTVCSQLLEDKIRREHPRIRLISSTTKCLVSDEDIVNELNRDYYLVVLDFRRNDDLEFVASLPHREKVEILVNEDCYRECVQRGRHYQDISQNILMHDQMPDTEQYCCGKYPTLYDSFAQATTIRVEDLYGVYRSLGIDHAKLRGRRSEPFDVLESYVYYLIRPEQRDRVRLEALRAGVVS